MTQSTTLVKNGWYQGAWSDEIGRTLMQRWIVGMASRRVV